MKTEILEKRKVSTYAVETEYSFNDICNLLDNEEKRYKNWEMKTYTLKESWDWLINRKDTFLTWK